ncbi:MAG: AAA family ATPase [Planctomycetota bacterium]|nr:MAG: AAA family ATPase [Planctomycetota bacterium]
MPEALKRVKLELGPDAVILGTRQIAPSGLGNLTGTPQVEITAAPADTVSPAPRVRASEGAERPAQPVASTAREQPGRSLKAPVEGTRFAAQGGAGAAPAPNACDALTRSYYIELVQREVAQELAQAISAEAAELARRGASREEALKLAVRKRIESLIASEDGATRSGPQRIALVGPPGAGKTTTIAKLAAHAKLRQRRSVALVTLDLHHLARNEPLRRYAEIVALPLVAPNSIAQVKDMLGEAQAQHDLLLIDTCGVGVRDQSRLVRLAAMLRACRPTETHLVVPASMAGSAQQRVRQAFAALHPTRLVLTRLDETVGMGAVLNAVENLHLGVSYTSDGQNVPFDLKPACPTHITNLVLG